MSYRAGFVGLIGLPNSGKSTLMNALVGEKVSIVTAKPQTTRRRMMGLVSAENYQMVFVDAPGVVKAKSGLNAFLREEAEDVISESDVLVGVLNIDESSAEHLNEIIEILKSSGKPWVGVINKTDLPQAHRVAILRDRLANMDIPTVQGSAMAEGKTLAMDLLKVLSEMLPEAKGPLYDQDLYTLSTTKDLVGEIIREKCFENLHQEIPFGLAVKVVRYNEEDPTLIKIHGEIMVAKDNHRPIVIGREGQQLKKIGTESRKEIEKLIGTRVFLDLKVQSKRGWQKNPGMMRELGYVLAKS